MTQQVRDTQPPTCFSPSIAAVLCLVKWMYTGRPHRSVVEGAMLVLPREGVVVDTSPAHVKAAAIQREVSTHAWLRPPGAAHSRALVEISACETSESTGKP